MDDSMTRSRPKSPTDILRELRENPAGRPTEQDPPPYDVSLLPEGVESFDPGSTDYKALGRVGSRTVPSLRFIRKDKSEIGCSYGHLDSRHPGGCEFIPSGAGKGNVIRLRFAGAEGAFSVVIEGRNLRHVWEMIMGHMTPWVHEYPADIDTEGEKATVVKSITFPPEN
jgi:hypothetical protein